MKSPSIGCKSRVARNVEKFVSHEDTDSGLIKSPFGCYTACIESPETKKILKRHGDPTFAREVKPIIMRNVIDHAPSPFASLGNTSKDDLVLLTREGRDESGIYSTENGLDLFTLKKRMDSTQSRVADFLKKQSGIGVMFMDVIAQEDREGVHYTLGDSAVAIQIVRNLAKLGVPRIKLFIASTDKLVLSQLRLLCPFGDFSGNPPWSISFEGSEVEVKLPEKESIIDICFTFELACHLKKEVNSGCPKTVMPYVPRARGDK